MPSRPKTLLSSTLEIWSRWRRIPSSSLMRLLTPESKELSRAISASKYYRLFPHLGTYGIVPYLVTCITHLAESKASSRPSGTLMPIWTKKQSKESSSTPSFPMALSLIGVSPFPNLDRPKLTSNSHRVDHPIPRLRHTEPEGHYLQRRKRQSEHDYR
jgi:hypothetical protein